MKMSKYLVAALAVLCVSGVAFGQEAAPVQSSPTLTPAPETSMVGNDRTAKNGVYIELLGAGGIYSLNYERFLANDVAARVGVMYWSASASNGTSSASASWLAVPLMFEYTGLRKGNHAFELSLGVSINHLSATSTTFSAFGDKTTLVAGTAFLGYRYQDPSGGILFRAGFTPLYFFGADAGAFLPWFGLSVGYGF